MGGRLWGFGSLLAGAAATALGRGHIALARFTFLFVVGLIVWTIVEYLMHRLAFHGFAPHWRHHEDPNNPAYILAPRWLSSSLAGALFGSCWFITGSWPAAVAMTCGVVTGYLAYELIHLRLHSAECGGTLLRILRRHHFYHHFASDQVCFGVTSPLWDMVFGSVPAERTPLRTARHRSFSR